MNERIDARAQKLEDSEDAVLEVTTALGDDELRAGQLGTQSYRNFAEAHTSEPRDLITAKELKRLYYFQVRYHCARYGTYADEPACLILLDLSFQQMSSFRFKGADIDIEFEDAANISLNLHEVVIDTTYRPRVLAFEPKEFHGPVTSVGSSTSYGVEFPIQAPGGVVGVTPKVERSKDFVRDSSFKVHRVIKEDPPSMIHWTVREDKLRKNGIRSELSVAMVVSYFPGHKFAARVRLRADVFLLLRPICGEKDDPIYFDSEVAPRRASNRVKEPDNGDCVPGVHRGKLDDVNLKKLTRLDSFGGCWLDN